MNKIRAVIDRAYSGGSSPKGCKEGSQGWNTPGNSLAAPTAHRRCARRSLRQRGLNGGFESCLVLEVHKMLYDRSGFINEEQGWKNGDAAVVLLHRGSQMRECEVKPVFLRVSGAVAVVVWRRR